MARRPIPIPPLPTPSGSHRRPRPVGSRHVSDGQLIEFGHCRDKQSGFVSEQPCRCPGSQSPFDGSRRAPDAFARSGVQSTILVRLTEPVFAQTWCQNGGEIAYDMQKKVFGKLRTFAGPFQVTSPYSDSSLHYLRLSMTSSKSESDSPDPARQLLSFVQITCQEPEQVPRIFRNLHAVQDVAFAYQPQRTSLPTNSLVTQCGKTPIPKPLYFNPAPVGMSVEDVWHLKGGKGQGQELVDIEVGWMLDHVELADKQIELIYGVNNPTKAAHGTEMLCTVCATNKFATVGIAPLVTNIKLVGDPNYDGFQSLIGPQIVAATVGLSYGGVLLIEIASTAVEVDPLAFHAIQLAVKKGIVVVEPAGNVFIDYDTASWEFFDYTQCSFSQQGPHCPPPKIVSLNPAGKSYVGDSGAVVVSVGTYGGPKGETPVSADYSAYGARINCFVSADEYSTCGISDSADYICKDGGGTSTASAAIAGAALVVQGIAEANLGVRLPPLWVRSLLSHLGTKNADADTMPMGVMPDLRQIAAYVLKMKFP